MPEDQEPRVFSRSAVDALIELLAVSEEYLVPVILTPDGTGWRISYVSDWPAAVEDEVMCKEIAVAHDLEVAAKAALRPLIEHGEAYFRYLDRSSS